MRIKLDENLPESLVAELCALGHDVDNVRMENLAGHDDDAVWKAAQEDRRFFVTQDLDFSDTRRFQPGSHYGVLLVRLPEAGRFELARRIRAVFREINVELWARCFVVLSEHKLRVISPAED